MCVLGGGGGGGGGGLHVVSIHYIIVRNMRPPGCSVPRVSTCGSSYW